MGCLGSPVNILIKLRIILIMIPLNKVLFYLYNIYFSLFDPLAIHFKKNKQTYTGKHTNLPY